MINGSSWEWTMNFHGNELWIFMGLNIVVKSTLWVQIIPYTVIYIYMFQVICPPSTIINWPSVQSELFAASFSHLVGKLKQWIFPKAPAKTPLGISPAPGSSQHQSDRLSHSFSEKKMEKNMGNSAYSKRLRKKQCQRLKKKLCSEQNHRELLELHKLLYITL